MRGACTQGCLWLTRYSRRRVPLHTARGVYATGDRALEMCGWRLVLEGAVSARTFVSSAGVSEVVRGTRGPTHYTGM